MAKNKWAIYGRYYRTGHCQNGYLQNRNLPNINCRNWNLPREKYSKAKIVEKVIVDRVSLRHSLKEVVRLIRTDITNPNWASETEINSFNWKSIEAIIIVELTNLAEKRWDQLNLQMIVFFEAATNIDELTIQISVLIKLLRLSYCNWRKIFNITLQ